MKRHSENGSALIATLCLLFTAGMIATAVLAVSNKSTFTLAAHLELQRSMFVAEGVANRAQWLISADLTNFPDREMSTLVYGDYDYDRYMSDGVPHTIDYYGQEVRFAVTDTISGWDMSAANFSASLNTMAQGPAESAQWEERLTELAALISDYTDSDDELSDDGRETGEYEELGMAPLPRNAACQYREELLYVREYRDVVPLDPDGRMTRTRLIPPDGLADLSGTPSLYTADEEMLRSYCLLEDAEITEVVRALSRLRTRREALSDNLSEELLEKLSPLATKESAYNTVTVLGPPEEQKKPFKRLAFSYQAFDAAGYGDGFVNYLEWIYF